MAEIDRKTAAVYVWQMFDGRWHIDALGGFAQAEMTATSMALHDGGLDRGFESRRDAEAALSAWRETAPC